MVWMVFFSFLSVKTPFIGNNQSNEIKKNIFSLRLLTSYISITKKGLYSFVLYSTDNFILAITINCNDIFESFVCANKYHTIL